MLFRSQFLLVGDEKGVTTLTAGALNSFDGIVDVAGVKRIVTTVDEGELPGVDCLGQRPAERVPGPPECRRAKSESAEARLVGRQYDRLSPCLACQVSREVVRKCRCALIGIADGRTGVIHDDACRTDVNENPRPRELAVLGTAERLLA